MGGRETASFCAERPVVSSFHLLQVMPLWTFLHLSCDAHMCANTLEWKHWALGIRASSWLDPAAVFQSGCTHLYSLWRGTWVLVAPHPHQHLVVYSFCHSYGGCSGISLQFSLHFHSDWWSQVPYPMFTECLDICVCKVAIQNIVHFSRGLSVFSYWIIEVLAFWIPVLCQAYAFKISCHPVACLFTLLIMSFNEQFFSK